MNTCSFYCFWKNLSIRHFWRKTTWSPILKGGHFIQFFLAYLVVTMSKLPHAKLTADSKTATLQFSTFQLLSFLKPSNSTGEWYLATSSLNNIWILNHGQNQSVVGIQGYLKRLSWPGLYLFHWIISCGHHQSLSSFPFFLLQKLEQHVCWKNWFDVLHTSSRKAAFKNILKVRKNPNHKIGPKSLNWLVCKIIWNELVNKQIIT